MRKSPGIERVFLPGEREARLRDERWRTGVPIPAEVLRELRGMGERVGIFLPLTLG